MRLAILAAIAAFAACTGFAQAPAPRSDGVPAGIAAPKDAPFPGTIRLAVDATDNVRRIFRVHETIPVAGYAEAAGVVLALREGIDPASLRRPLAPLESRADHG